MYAGHEGGGHGAAPPAKTCNFPSSVAAAACAQPSMSSHEDGTSNVDNNTCSTNVVPAELSQGTQFTEQDEARELATLTIQDLLKLQSDLTGVQSITNGMMGMGFGTSSTDISGGGALNGAPNVSGPSFLLSRIIR